MERKVIGPDVAKGETRMLLVGTGVWKRSSLLDEDIGKARAGTEAERDETNCLITEVVVPGFHWQDHKFMDMDALEGLFEGVHGGEEKIREFAPFIFAGGEEEIEAAKAGK